MVKATRRLPPPTPSSQPQGGGVVFVEFSGAVSLIDSNVTGCSADYASRVA